MRSLFAFASVVVLTGCATAPAGPKIQAVAVANRVNLPVNQFVTLATLTLNQNGRWAIQAKAQFAFEPKTAGHTGDLRCTLAGIPVVAGLPQGAAATVIDRSGVLLDLNNSIGEWVAYQGILDVVEPTNVSLQCQNFMIGGPADDAVAVDPRITAILGAP